MGSIALRSEIVPGQRQTIIESMKQASEAIKTTAILQNLQFPSMNDRFRNVRDSAPNTFRWIFEDPQRLLSKEPELHISFTKWLRSGSGIFHIAGKPGSGKSTLMKFICEHEQVGPLLREWGGSRETISATFFFWRIGSVNEKSLGGLIRGLLFAVIQQEPDLAQLLFPRFWNSTAQNPSFPQSIYLTDREISSAFDKMTQNDALLEKFRMCFFVDGLDELEQTESATHYTLTRKIWEWTSKSKGNIKFCVASREMPVFERAFPENQRITIQTFTAGDIENLVRQRLGENAIFQDLKKSHESKCEKLMKRIIMEAEGVFLWVVLLLSQLEESLADGDSIVMLERILQNAPRELDAFFLSILDSIPERYRESAYTTMAVAMRQTGILLSNQTMEPKYRNMDSWVEFGNIVSLVGCSFIFEASDRGDLSDLPTDFPQCGGLAEMEARIESARSQLKARCRGLLACPSNKFLFTHRSIPEFLQRTLNQTERSYQIDDHQVAERLAWMLLSELKYGFYRKAKLGVTILVEIFRQTSLECVPRAFLLLRIMDELLYEQFITANGIGNECKYGLAQAYASGIIGDDSMGVLPCAACYGLHEYVAWELTTNTHLKNAQYYGVNALASCIGFKSSIYNLFQGDTLDALFRSGVPVDAAYPKYGDGIGDKHVLLWHHWLVCYLFTNPTLRDSLKSLWLEKLPDYVWCNIEIWLRHGADPDVSLSWVSPHTESVDLSDDPPLLEKSNEDDRNTHSDSINPAPMCGIETELDNPRNDAETDPVHVALEREGEDGEEDGGERKGYADKDTDDVAEEDEIVRSPASTRSDTSTKFSAHISMHWAGGEVWTFNLPSNQGHLNESEIPASAVESLFKSSGMSITLQEFIEFRNPSGSDEIIRLMQRNRRLKEEAAFKAAKASDPPPAEPDAESELAGVTAHIGTATGPELIFHPQSQPTTHLPGFWTRTAVWVPLST